MHRGANKREAFGVQIQEIGVGNGAVMVPLATTGLRGADGRVELILDSSFRNIVEEGFDAAVNGYGIA